jgi:leader peptidase (prepilin peptidase)/N-methyltransferase
MCTVALLISMLLGGAVSILLMALKIKKRKEKIPFGPFIAIASLITILFGERIWEWYF